MYANDINQAGDYEYYDEVTASASSEDQDSTEGANSSYPGY